MPIPQPLETQRTIMRPMTVADAEDFYTLNLDPEVIKYTGDQAFPHLQAAEDFLLRYEQYEQYGLGRMGVIEKPSGDFLGWCGLKYSPDTEEYDLGFRFYRRYWNRGYATETALRSIEFGFQELGLRRIIGRARKENPASVRVLGKVGMRLEKGVAMGGHAWLIYASNFPGGYPSRTTPYTGVLHDL